MMREDPESLARSIWATLQAIPRVAPLASRNSCFYKASYRPPRPRDEFGGCPRISQAKRKGK